MSFAAVSASFRPTSRALDEATTLAVRYFFRSLFGLLIPKSSWCSCSSRTNLQAVILNSLRSFDADLVRLSRPLAVCSSSSVNNLDLDFSPFIFLIVTRTRCLISTYSLWLYHMSRCCCSLYWYRGLILLTLAIFSKFTVFVFPTMGGCCCCVWVLLVWVCCDDDNDDDDAFLVSPWPRRLRKLFFCFCIVLLECCDGDVDVEWTALLLFSTSLSFDGSGL